MKHEPRRALSLLLSLCLLTGAVSSAALAAESAVMADPSAQAETAPRPETEGAPPAEPAAVGEATGVWLTVPGVQGGKLRFDSAKGAITDCENTVTVANIPERINGVRVTQIEMYTFSSRPALTSVTVPGSVTNIDTWVFRDCAKLASVTLSKGVTTLQAWAFRDCPALTGITIPETVTVLNTWAFERCTGLTSVTLPVQLTHICRAAFRDCDRITDIYYAGTRAQWSKVTVDEENDELAHATIHCSDGTATGLPTGDPAYDPSVGSASILSVRLSDSSMDVSVSTTEAGVVAHYAAYTANGRLLAWGYTAPLQAGQHPLSFPTFFKGARRVKVMLLSPRRIPLCPAKELLIP